MIARARGRVRLRLHLLILALPVLSACSDAVAAGTGKGVRGTWIATHYQGQPIPPEGFFFKAGGVRVRNVSLRFDKPNEGQVIGQYQEVLPGGVAHGIKRQAGSFKYDGDDKTGGTVTVFAYSKEVSGAVTMDAQLSYDFIEVDYWFVDPTETPATPIAVRMTFRR